MELADWLAPGVVVAIAIWMNGRLDKRFDAVDKRFDAVDKRFDAVDKRFDAVAAEVRALTDTVSALRERVASIEGFLRGRDREPWRGAPEHTEE